MSNSFKPAFWLGNAHLQTIWAQIFRLKPGIRLKRKRTTLPDGDFIDIDWTTIKEYDAIVLVLPGLGGNRYSKYALGLLRAFSERGWSGALVNYRGSSGEPNLFPHSFHAGAYGDLLSIARKLKAKHPGVPLYVVGVSIGGSILLNGLGRNEEMNQLVDRAVAISVPYDLGDAASQLDRGFSRHYQRYLLKTQKKMIRQKFGRLTPPASVQMSRLDIANNFFKYDDYFTAPLHDFKGVDDYYGQCSCKQYLSGIKTPTLLIHAKDDPFMTIESAPSPGQLSDQVTLEYYEHGGHVGFVSGLSPFTARYWLESRVPEFLDGKDGGDGVDDE